MQCSFRSLTALGLSIWIVIGDIKMPGFGTSAAALVFAADIALFNNYRQQNGN